MSLEQARHFLRQVRNDQSLHTRIIDNQDELTADALVALGSELGYLQPHRAYRHEWTTRWMHYRSRQNNR